MRRIFGLALALLAGLSIAGAQPVPNGVVLLPPVHDGISLDFASNTHYVKAPGQAARYGKFTDLFTFTRNSTATYRGADGLLKYANENQFQQSQTLDNVYWTKTASSISANAVAAPDGTTTADKLVEDSASTVHLIQRSTATTGLIQTISVFAKAAERSWVLLCLGNGTDCAYFNVSTCAAGTVTGSATTSTWSGAGSGWCRVRMTGRVLGNTNAQILLATADATSNYLGDGASGLYLWGAQLQNGRDLGDYLVTTTAAKYDQPRVEFGPTGELRGLLIEGARTNSILQSEDIATTWTVGNATTSTNQTAAPDGSTTADRLVEDATAATNHYVTQGVAKAAAAIQYTASVFLKAGTKGFAHIRISNGALTNGAGVGINLSTGAIGSAYTFGGSPFTSASAAVETWGSGWYRLVITATSEAASTTLATTILLATGTNSADVTFNGDGASYVNVWGAMLETPVAFASSYTPTTTGSVARAADQAARTFGGEYVLGGPSTVFIQADTPAVNIPGSKVFFVNDGSGRHLQNPSSAATIAIFDGTNSATSGGAISNNTPFKAASAQDSNGLALSLDGGTVATGSYDGSFGAASTVSIGGFVGGGNEIFGHIRLLDYWPVRKPNDFLTRKTQPGYPS